MPIKVEKYVAITQRTIKKINVDIISEIYWQLAISDWLLARDQKNWSLKHI